MNKQALTSCYRAHLARINGQPIDTPTGTLTFSHAYRRRNGKVVSPATVERKFNKGHGWRGYRVERIEVYTFDADQKGGE